MKYTALSLFLSFGIAFFTFAQEQLNTKLSVQVKDTTSVPDFLKRGSISGLAKTYFAATINEKDLSDYHAWAVGAGIGYQTPVFFHRFQAKSSGFVIYNLTSTDLAKPEPTTGQINRYEAGLFDIEHPDKKAIYRLEELFLKVNVGKKSSLTVGRQIPQTPFINPQDGRMRPTLTESGVLEWKEWKNLSLHGEYIWRMSPRSTVRWYDVGDTFGIYPSGIDPTGKPAQYKGQVKTRGIGILGATYQKNQWNVQAWNTYVDNVMNTLLLKAEWKSTPSGGKNWLTGVQLIRQNTVGNGGNSDVAKAYTLPGSTATVISGRVGRQSSRFDWYLNATRITSEGRFLMPREWGREPFYTFMPRERNEGAGDVTAATLNTFFKPKKNLRLEVSGGIFKLPDVKNYALNKYGQPAYMQLNLGMNYQFKGYLKGLDGALLLVRKNQLGKTYENDRYVLNKVNMTHFNFILTYRF